MNKERAKNELINPKLKQGEELVGFFQAQYIPSNWWIFLIGPLILFGMRVYYVAVTDQGMHFHKLTLFGKPDIYNYFPWNEIENLKLEKGFLTAPLKLKFSNGRELKLKVQLKGLENIAKLEEETKEFLISKMS